MDLIQSESAHRCALSELESALDIYELSRFDERWSASLRRVLQGESASFDVDPLIETLSEHPRVAALYDLPNLRHVSLKEHHRAVLGQFQKYFADREFAISPQAIRLLLSLHDIAKPVSLQTGRDQHACHIDFIRSIEHLLPIAPVEMKAVYALLSSDPIGLCAQGKMDLEEAADLIVSGSEYAGIELRDFFLLKLVYYQCDSSSYTSDVGHTSFLDGQFVFRENGDLFVIGDRMVHTHECQQRVDELETRLFGSQVSAA